MRALQEEFMRGDTVSSQILTLPGPVDWDKLLEPDDFFEHFKNYLQVWQLSHELPNSSPISNAQYP